MAYQVAGTAGDGRGPVCGVGAGRARRARGRGVCLDALVGRAGLEDFIADDVGDVRRRERARDGREPRPRRVLGAPDREEPGATSADLVVEHAAQELDRAARAVVALILQLAGGLHERIAEPGDAFRRRGNADEIGKILGGERRRRVDVDGDVDIDGRGGSVGDGNGRDDRRGRVGRRSNATALSLRNMKRPSRSIV